MRKHFTCPACGSKLAYNGSRQETSIFRRTYALCSNTHCGASWQISTEITKCVKTPQAPYKNPIKKRD